MKKIILSVLLCFLFLPTCLAKNLNFQSVMLMDYRFYIEGVETIPIEYINNETGNMIYIRSPYEPVEYTLDYEEIHDNLEYLDTSTKSKLKKYMTLTLEKEGMEKDRYYLCTQVLIWNILNPEIKIELDETLKETQKEIDAQQLERPNWIKNEEIIDEFVIPKKEGYWLSSDTCSIKEQDDNWVILSCQDNNTIWVEETKENSWRCYEIDSEIKAIEESDVSNKWSFELTKIKQEPSPIIPVEETPKTEEIKKEEPEAEKPTEISNNQVQKEEQETKEKQEERKETNNTIAETKDELITPEENQLQIAIDNIPNTIEDYPKEKVFSFLSVILICIVIRKKLYATSS